MKATIQKTMLTMAAALGAANAQAVTPELSGFVDMSYTLSDGTWDPADSPDGQRWGVAAEMDYKLDMAANAKARFDLDMNLSPDSQYYNLANDGYPVVLEQAFMGWRVSEVFQISAGAFNNPLGWEAEDAPDMYQISHGQIYNLFDQATHLYGNNVAGIAGSFKAGIATVTIALLNDLGNVAEQTSFGAVVNFRPVQSLDVEAGLLTQNQADPAYPASQFSMEQIVDVNATWKSGLMTVGGEVLLADALVDNAMGLTFNYQFNEQAGATFRYDTVSYEANGVDATTTITLAASYMVEKNLSVNVEMRMQDDPNDPDTPGAVTKEGIIGDGDIIALEFVASF